METTLAVLAHAGWGGWWIFPLVWIALIALVWTLAWRGPWRRRAWWPSEGDGPDERH